ncbi:hypothetical protein FACS189428_7230 [Clostridia bacterium]|nr:hypothetical protein FACS189428_7230 [Clostridia bacterium]
MLPPARLRPVQTTGGIGSEANGGAVEIAFSLSPESIAQAYEPRTASLSQKLQAIQALLDLNYRVGLRFLPLLPVPEYENIYTSLLTEVKKQIDISRISSIFIAPLIYNQGDFAVMKKKNPDFPFRDRLHRDKKGLMKMEDEHYQRFLQIFQEAFPEKEILWDYR